MSPILHHDFIRSDERRPTRWMLVAAGIYGAGRNWASVARRFVRARPEWGCVTVDLRQHGQSMGFEPPHTIRACAGDLLRLSAHLDVEIGAILGHSFGGKVALAFADACAAQADAPFVEAVWVVDSTPQARDAGGSAWSMLRVLRGAPGPFAERSEGVAAVEAAGFALPVAQWMSTNLARWGELDEPRRTAWTDRNTASPGPDDEDFVWRLDPDDMEELLRSFFSTDLWRVVEAPQAGAVLHVIKARESSILDDTACARIEAAGLATGRARLHRVDGGHWVNADNPTALQELLVREMP